LPRLAVVNVVIAGSRQLDELKMPYRFQIWVGIRNERAETVEAR
jgi:hypothetical protein